MTLPLPRLQPPPPPPPASSPAARAAPPPPLLSFPHHLSPHHRRAPPLFLAPDGAAGPGPAAIRGSQDRRRSALTSPRLPRPPRGLHGPLRRRRQAPHDLTLCCAPRPRPLAAGPLPPQASARLKSFQSSLGLSRKAFRLSKFVQTSTPSARTPAPSLRPSCSSPTAARASTTSSGSSSGSRKLASSRRSSSPAFSASAPGPSCWATSAPSPSSWKW
ncbi:hypothetical protein ACQJBY_007595 [Aegilops geniculata]